MSQTNTSKPRKNIGTFLKELAVVIVGILVALFINNWNESRKQQHYLDKTLSAIGEEIQNSIEELEEIIPKHNDFLLRVEEGAEDTTKSILSFFQQTDGFQFPEVKNIGLRFFVMNGAHLIDYSIISGLTEIESIQDIFHAKIEHFSEVIYEDAFGTGVSSKMKMMVILSDVVTAERDMLKKYQEFLDGHQDVFSIRD